MKVKIVKVVSPVCYIALRDRKFICPVTSKTFFELDEEINRYYHMYDIVSDLAAISKAGQIVIVRHTDRRFYRARVKTIIQRSSGYELVLDLVDTAERITTPTACVRPINEEFLLHTHHAVKLILPEINPCSCKLDIETMKSEYRESEIWDSSATIFIKEKLKKQTETTFETFKIKDTGELVGNLYFNIDGDTVCVNDVLVEENYGVRVLNSDVAFSSDENESCSEMSLGASATCYCPDRHSKTPPTSEAQPTKRHTPLQEWNRLQQELSRKAAELMSDEDMQLSPVQVKSAKQEGKRNSPGCSPASSLSLHSLPSKELSARSCTSCSESRSVSRGTQYEPPGCDQSNATGYLQKETKMTDKQITSISPTSKPISRPPSSAEQILSRVKRALIITPLAPASKETKAVPVVSPILPTLPCSLNHASSNKIVTSLSSPVDSSKHTLSSSGSVNARSSRVPSGVDTHLLNRKLHTTQRIEMKAKKIPKDSPSIKSTVPAKSCAAVCTIPATRHTNDQTSDAPKTQSLSYRVPFGRGYPLKGITNPQVYIRPGSSTSDKPTSSSVINMTPTENVSAKAINHCSSTSFPASSFRNNMVDPLGLLENVRCRKILVCGSKPLPPKPVVDIPAFFHGVERSLKRIGIIGPSIIQSYAWPAIMRGRNIAVISGPQSGKSMTYVPPLISMLLDKSFYAEIPQGNEPLALVVCSSWRSAKRVFDQCQNINEGVGCVRTLLIHGGGYDETQKIELINGCDILVATPCALLRLLSTAGTKPTSLNRLCYLVLDDADILTEEFTDQLREIVREFAAVLKKRGPIGTPSQIMAFGTKWTNGLKSFFGKIMPSPLLYCASFHESVIYAGIKIILHTFPEERKTDHLLELLKANLRSNNVKTVICTFSVDAAESLYKIMSFISEKNRKRAPTSSKLVHVAHEELTSGQVKYVHEHWHGEHKDGNFPILIATDAILDDLNIEDATCLIHFDIPEMSKSQFGFRFSCLLKYMRKATATDAVKSDCLSHIITTEKCVYQARALISLMERLSGEIPHALKALALGFYRGREECKQPVPLCYYLKSFGSCPNQYWCSDRHMLLEETDKPSEKLLRGGLIRALISNVRNASHFYGRIIEYQLQDGTWEDGYKTFMLLNFDLNLHFANRRNCLPHGRPEIGDICAIPGTDSSYYRVRVLTQTPVSRHSNLRKVGIVFIDSGTLSSVLVSDLLKLPIELQSIAPQAVEIFLANTKPIDKDQEFTIKAYRMAQDLLLNEVIDGTVALSLGSTVWLKDIIKQTKLACTGDYVYDFDFRKKLQAQFAMDNPTHLVNLEKLCSGIFELQAPIRIQTSNKNSASKVLKSSVEPDYAFLPLDEPELVSIASVFTPGEFYLTKRQSLDCLEQLMTDLEEYFREKSTPPAENIFQGMLCAVRCSSTNDYYRSRVLSLTENGTQTTDEDDVCIFWSDYGEKYTVKRNNVFSLPDKFLTKLPLQAIKCSLSNVVPVSDSWTENAANFMWEQHLNEDGSYKELLVKAVRKTKDPISMGNIYEVELYDPSDGIRDVSFADLLCDANHAKLAPMITVEDAIPECKSQMSHRQGTFSENCDSKDETMLSMDSIGSQDESLPDGFKDQEDVASSTESIPSSIPKNNEELSYQSIVSPMVMWWDTKATVYLKILISGVKDHIIDLQPTHFLYRAKVKDVVFLVDINLYDEVEHEAFSRSISENFVRIVIPKRKHESKWPRLRKEKTKTPWITIDYDHVGLSTSEEEELSDLQEFEWHTSDQDKTAVSSVKRNILPLDVDEFEESDSDTSDSDIYERCNRDDHSIF